MYKLIQSTAVADGKATVIYGIECDGYIFPHISESKEAVGAIVELCNRYEVHPVHVEDIAEDYLYS